tara:strand:+ start:1057 stop:1701 length:645 start_codon:yes stop_codon:yes gene_type:complete
MKLLYFLFPLVYGFNPYASLGKYQSLFQPNIFMISDIMDKNDNILLPITEKSLEKLSSTLRYFDVISHKVLETNEKVTYDVIHNPNMSLETKERILLQMVNMVQSGDNTGYHILNWYYFIIQYIFEKDAQMKELLFDNHYWFDIITQQLPKIDQMGHEILRQNENYIHIILENPYISYDLKKVLIMNLIHFVQMGDQFGSFVLEQYSHIADKIL